MVIAVVSTPLLAAVTSAVALGTNALSIECANTVTRAKRWALNRAVRAAKTCLTDTLTMGIAKTMA